MGSGSDDLVLEWEIFSIRQISEHPPWRVSSFSQVKGPEIRHISNAILSVTHGA